MADVPIVTDRLLQGAGSPSAVINVLKGDDSDDARAFMRVYLSIPEEVRYRLSLEEIFTAAGLTGRRFIEVVTGAMMQQAQDISRMMIAVAQPKVSAALVRAATEERPIFNRKGEEIGTSGPDMKAIEIFGKMSGMMPTPKGSQTIINMQQLNQGGESESSTTHSAILEPMDDFLKELQPVVRPELPAPRPKTEIPIRTPDVEYRFSEI